LADLAAGPPGETAPAAPRTRAGRAGKAPPTWLVDGLTLAAGLGTYQMWLAAGTDATTAGELGMSETEAGAVARPAARIIVRTRAWAAFQKRFGKTLGRHQDWMLLAGAVGAYGARIGPLVYQLAARDRPREQAGPRPAAPAATPDGSSGNGAFPLADRSANAFDRLSAVWNGQQSGLSGSYIPPL
jgi:hypothetical protein